MKLAKKFFVGCLILLLSITPLFVTAELSKNISIAHLSIYDNNSLGTLELQHEPILSTFSTFRGLKTRYYEPEGNPNYEYHFPEVNGSVRINFTLHVKHLKNPIPGYILPSRFSGVTVYIAKSGGEQICYSQNFTFIDNASYVSYNISIPSLKSIFTNGSNMTLILWGEAFPVPSIFRDSPKFGLWTDFCEKFFVDEYAGFKDIFASGISITIIPDPIR